MTDQGYAVVFDGTVADGQDVAAVKQRLQRLLKITESQVERLFTGRPVTLKKGLSPADAQRFAAAFAQAGALCKLVQMSPPGPQAAASQPLSVEGIDQLFHREFAQRAPTLSYRLGLAGVALLMLCLPLASLAMIVGTAAAVTWYVSGGVPGRVQYPLQRAGSGVSVWEHLQEYLPVRDETPHSHVEFVQALDYQLQQLHEQLMRFLAGIALRYERHLGVEPLSIQVRKATA